MKSLHLSKPHLIVMVGIPGSGKSFFAEKFAETFRAPCISEGRIIDLVPEVPDAAPFIASMQLGELLKTGQTVVFDGSSATRTARQDLAKQARATGYEPLLVWVQTDPATAETRATRATKASTNRIVTPEEFDRALKRFTPPATTERPVVISGKHTYASQAKMVLKRLSGPRAEISSHATPPVRPGQTEQRSTTRRNISVR